MINNNNNNNNNNNIKINNAQKNRLIRKIRLISRFMMSQPG